MALADLALEGVEGGRPRLDAQALRDNAPALAPVALVIVGDFQAGPAQLVGQRAGVIDVARRPATVVVQVADERTRRAEADHDVVDEPVGIAAREDIDVPQAGVHPGITRARAEAHGDVVDHRLRTGRGEQAETKHGSQEFAVHR